MRRVLPLLPALLLTACSPLPEERSSDRDDSLAGSLSSSIPIVAVADEPDQLVPPLARTPSSSAIWPWILPSLVRIESDSAGSVRFTGDVATSWRVEDGGRSVRFALDDRCLWEDTTAVDVADVVGTYLLYRSPDIGGDWSGRLAEIASVVPGSDLGGVVVFRFHRALSTQRILQLASLPLISIDQWAATRGRRPALGGAGRPVLSAGPFRVGEWVRGDFLTLERHPFPPQARRPAAERIMLRFVPSGRARSMQFEQGLVQLAIDLPIREATRLRDSPRGRGVVGGGPICLEVLVWNLEDRYWGRLENRRAIRSALDSDRLQRAFCPETTPTERERLSFLGDAFADSAGAPGIAPDADSLPQSNLDAEEDRVPLEILYDAADEGRERLAVEIAVQLHRLGMDCNLEPISAEGCLLRIRERDFQAVLVGYEVPPLPDLGELFGGDGVYNIAGLRDPTIDDLIAEARSAASDTLPGLWQRVERRASELLPCLLLARSVRTDAVDPRLTDYRPDPLQPYGNLLAVRRPWEIDQ